MTDEDLLKALTARIARNPKTIVPRVLDAISAGMDAWSAAVQKHLDHQADFAITSGLSLPPRASSWKVGKHGALARLTAVGWGLNRRKAGSRIEIELVEFVRKADAADPEDAANHYDILNLLPIPPDDSGYE